MLAQELINNCGLMNSHFTYNSLKSYNDNGFYRTGSFLSLAENQ